MRAREPDQQGYVDRGGVRVAYESFGEPAPGRPTVVFVPIDTIVHSRAWKAQVPFLARFAHVVTIDPRGNGRSDRPTDPAEYALLRFAEDTVAVLDALDIEQAVLVGICESAWEALLVAALHPGRVAGVVAIAPWAHDGLSLHRDQDDAYARFEEARDDDEGWAKANRYYWQRDWPGFADFFFRQVVTEPHSTKLIEDLVGYARESSPDVQLANAVVPAWPPTVEESDALMATVRCPVLVIHGSEDRCQPLPRGERLARILPDARLVTLEGCGHLPMGRDPVRVNLLLREFVNDVYGVHAPVRWQRAMDRRPRVLFASSPIGLGHARRDLAIARELRTQRPEVEISWLTQEPVASFLAAHGETIHPATAHLASESRHFESVAGEHDLHAFQAIREMDEILVNNFMVFNDLVADEHFDLWVGDEAWDLDHFLHENPELKRAPFAWLTDFVGWLPMPDGGPAEAALTTDYNKTNGEARK